MLKKSLFVASSLVVFGLFVGMNSVNAESAELNGEKINLNGRATVVVREVTLISGQLYNIDVGSINSSDFATKILFKYSSENPENDYFVFKHDRYLNGVKTVTTSMSNNNNTVNEYKYSPASDLNYPVATATERFTIINYSVKPKKFKIGITSGMHMKQNVCIDYSDIDFNL
ncbi:hypothetical protein ACWOC1_10405 [Enterococcus quebecensis]|uniref:DUF5626 domain-containing protein n=1 Tax=Enterococcus quebecensis TaxID=903983 RepID=A0A1E5H2L3_9ENTE|nr:hypothetical protein [Enterococcus quebecensis]OEG18870.1 hypothetical protein BCR23_13095 [Enterococcus quebecensis]OJG71311.1 hypothetical protein RV12_GL001573 [Enterococcus quebecensis]